MTLLNEITFLGDQVRKKYLTIDFFKGLLGFIKFSFITFKLNEKVRSQLDQDIDRVYNLRLVASADNSIDLSYTLKTRPITQARSIELRDKMVTSLKDQNNFIKMSVRGNSTFKTNDKAINVSGN